MSKSTEERREELLTHLMKISPMMPYAKAAGLMGNERLLLETATRWNTDDRVNALSTVCLLLLQRVEELEGKPYMVLTGKQDDIKFAKVYTQTFEHPDPRTDKAEEEGLFIPGGEIKEQPPFVCGCPRCKIDPTFAEPPVVVP